MQSVDKEYLATIRLGKTTDTYDADGRTVSERPLPIISTQEIDHLLSQFRGPVKQLAPMFSAVKVGGERLYKAARRGELRERPLRVVHIYELELLGQQDETWEIRILCSSGTYVRSLAHDLGEKLGCGAHLQRLRRTRSGDYHLSGAVPLGEFEEEWKSAFVPINQLLPVFPVVTVNKEEAMGILHGNPLHHSRTVEGEFCRLFFNDLLLAIGKPEGSTIYPKIVLRREI
jgi:tRNA pseudouridine55 synthase